MTRAFPAALLALTLAACQNDSADSTAEAIDPTEAGLVAYTNATFWDGTGDDAVADGVMVVRNGRIESIGTGPVPANATTVDLGDGYVIPGFINAHGHISGRWADAAVTDTTERVIGDLKLLARQGVTTVNSLGGEPAEALVVRNTQNTPLLDRARLYVAGPVIAESDPDAARRMAEENIERGVDWLKLRVDDNLGRSEKMSWEAVQAVLDTAAELEIPVATHIFYQADASKLIEMGSALIAHSVRDEAISNEFIQQLGESGVCYVPTLTREISTFVYAERPKFFDDPFFLEFANRSEMERVSTPEFMAEMADSDVAAGYRVAWVQAMENLRELSDANVPIAFGTDSGPPGRFPGFFEHMELEMMVMAGLSAERALMSATIDAADCLGLDDVGTLEVGKWADFQVLEEDPVSNIAATKTLRNVYVAGNEVTR